MKRKSSETISISLLSEKRRKKRKWDTPGRGGGERKGQTIWHLHYADITFVRIVSRATIAGYQQLPIAIQLL